MKRRMLNSFSLVGLVLLLIACGSGRKGIIPQVQNLKKQRVKTHVN